MHRCYMGPALLDLLGTVGLFVLSVQYSDQIYARLLYEEWSKSFGRYNPLYRGDTSRRNRPGHVGGHALSADSQ